MKNNSDLIFRKKEKKAEKEYELKLLIELNNSFCILVLVIVVKKMVKKKNPMVKIVKRRRNNCTILCSIFFSFSTQ
jgi:hypothetical protein